MSPNVALMKKKFAKPGSSANSVDLAAARVLRRVSRAVSRFIKKNNYLCPCESRKGQWKDTRRDRLQHPA